MWSPGRAPALPGTRSERPSAVTLTTTWPARVVSPPRTGDAGRGHALVELDDILQLDVARQRKRDEQRLRPRRRRSEVADVDRGGAEAELAPGEPVEPEVDALDERVLGDDEAAGELGGVVLGSLDQPARLELAQEAELARLRELHRRPPAAPRSRRRARITATPAAPARMHSAAFDASIAADRDHGDRDREADVAQAVDPDRRRRVRLRGRRPDRPRAEVGRTAELGDRALAPRRHRDPERDPGRVRPLDPGVALTEMDADAELERRVDVVVDDQLGVEAGERPPERDHVRRRRALQPQLHDRRPAGRGPPSRLLVGHERVQPHERRPCV